MCSHPLEHVVFIMRVGPHILKKSVQQNFEI